MLNFLVKRPWGHNVSLLQNFEVIYTLSLSVSIYGVVASDFLDMKMLIGSVTYFKQHLCLGKTRQGASEPIVSSTLQYIQYRRLCHM